MKLVTFQSVEAFHILQKTGVLRTDESRLDFPRYQKVYDFIVQNMKDKNIRPENGEKYPIWAWAKCGGHIGPRKVQNKAGVMQNKIKIIFEKKDEDVLVSDYMAYSFILSGLIVPKTLREYNLFQKEMEQKGILKDELKAWIRGQKNPKIPAERIEKTWNNIFKLKSNVYQACFWQITKDEIINVDMLNDKTYLYGSMNRVRPDGTRPDWKQKYLEFLK